METVKYLRSDGLQSLVDTFKVTARRHGKYPGLVQLKYSQIDSPMGERVVQECRGLIVDEADKWNVVAYPYDKFFNYGENLAAKIDWPSAIVYEKLDGSLMTVYWHAGQWHVASSGMPDAAGPVNGLFAGTFADLFWQTWTALGYQMPRHVDACYMFELLTPFNRVVCKQPVNRIVLHGVREMSSRKEAAPEYWADMHGWQCVRSFPLGTLEDCLAAAGEIDPMAGEGYVVRDHAFRRIKVKAPRYVAMAHLKDGMSGRRMLEIVRAGESSEFLSHFPEFGELFERTRTAFDALCAQADGDFASLHHLEDRKAFALEAVKTSCSPALFAMKSGKAKSAREFYANCTLQALERAVGIEVAA